MTLGIGEILMGILGLVAAVFGIAYQSEKSKRQNAETERDVAKANVEVAEDQLKKAVKVEQIKNEPVEIDTDYDGFGGDDWMFKDRR